MFGAPAWRAHHRHDDILQGAGGRSRSTTNRGTAQSHSSHTRVPPPCRRSVGPPPPSRRTRSRRIWPRRRHSACAPSWATQLASWRLRLSLEASLAPKPGASRGSGTTRDFSSAKGRTSGGALKTIELGKLDDREQHRLTQLLMPSEFFECSVHVNDAWTSLRAYDLTRLDAYGGHPLAPVREAHDVLQGHLIYQSHSRRSIECLKKQGRVVRFY